MQALRWKIAIGCVAFCCVLLGKLLTPPLYAQDNVTCAADVIVQPGDTLSAIAARQTGTQLTYQAIVVATNAKAATDRSYAIISNPGVISVGWKLCIPAGGSVVAAVTAPQATVAPVIQPTPTPAATPIPLVTPPTLNLKLEEMHPLMVEYMRQQEYPGSEVVIEQVLAPGVNYNRYIASYRSEGYKIYALLTVPQGVKPATGWPVIIFNHGFIPPEIYRTTERYVAYVDGFARNGYIVFRSDYRGHGFSEGEPTSSRGDPAYTIDVLNAVATMKRYADADPNRIGMWGHSMGGLLTLRSMVTTKDIKVGVIWAGVVAPYDVLYRRRNNDATPEPTPADPTAAQRRRWRQEMIDRFGTPEENPAAWAAISPNSYVRDLSGPMQLHHGTADGEVPLEYSQILNAQIASVGGVVEYYEYPGDNHNLAVNFGTVMARSVAFFDKYLK
ncbi:MAG: alpha/beta fold hydrolase [Caldilineaceae bacterium]